MRTHFESPSSHQTVNIFEPDRRRLKIMRFIGADNTISDLPYNFGSFLDLRNGQGRRRMAFQLWFRRSNCFSGIPTRPDDCLKELFYLQRSRQIKARKVLFLLLLLWGHISCLLKYSFLVCVKQQTFSEKEGCEN